MKPFVVALLGAESTGKSQLSFALAGALRDKGYIVSVVTEYLREWCDAQGRVPVQNEQAVIAQMQSQRIDVAYQSGCDVVIADTTALMTAVYSDYAFGDLSLYDSAIAQQKNYALTLLLGLDLPWVADGWQRDGAHVREAVDSKIRQALQAAGIAAPTIYGTGTVRVQAALAAALQAMQPRTQDVSQSPSKLWKHFCECCGDGECERLTANGLIAIDQTEP